jgi:hypothetical protein
MRLTYERNAQGKKLCGIRKCDSCGKEEFLQKPRRWDICASCDMKQRYDAGKTVPPKQIKKVSYVNFCEYCGRAYAIVTTAALQRGKTRQLHCSIKCSREAAKTETCRACGKRITPNKHDLCPKCDTKRWQREEVREYLRKRYRDDLNYRLGVLIRGRVKTALRSQLNRPKNPGTLVPWNGDWAARSRSSRRISRPSSLTE